MSFILKEIDSQSKLITEMMRKALTVALAMRVKTVLMMITEIVQTCCTKQNIEQNSAKIIRYLF